ncbi:MAG TPA: hypothetical protein EYH45_04515 [Candidatus Caldiarchaeum subterraneum]|uniref:Uncharacterized protein n=1 Tax=Caldiarchaeum subterraneum TaxID=311458 RepID=A0A833ECH6_CALS0|nr:hypothetical protein [Candidatus Caldarchaeum subterraneum]
MPDDILSTPFTLLGIILVIVGVLLIATPYIVKLIAGEGREPHPLLFIGFKMDGMTVGTSPILIIALVVIYLVLLMMRGWTAA